MARATILKPWASTPNAHTDDARATCSTLGQPSSSASCSWPGRSFDNQCQAEEAVRWKTQKSLESWRNVSSSRTKPPRPTYVQVAIGRFPPVSATWSSCRSTPLTFADTGTAGAGSDAGADPFKPGRSERSFDPTGEHRDQVAKDHRRLVRHLGEDNEAIPTEDVVDLSRRATPAPGQHSAAAPLEAATGNPLAPCAKSQAERDTSSCEIVGSSSAGMATTLGSGNDSGPPGPSLQRDQNSRFSLTLARFPIRSRR